MRSSYISGFDQLTPDKNLRESMLISRDSAKKEQVVELSKEEIDQYLE